MSFAHLKEGYDRDGFAVVRNFYSPDELEALKRELDRYITEVIPTLPDKHAFYEDRSRPETLKQMQMMQEDAYFAEIAKHPRWIDLAETLIGEEVLALGPEWFNKPPGTNHPTPPHQDNYYFNLVPPNVATIWMALDDVDEENGCIRYVPGSHLTGFRPHGRTSVLGFSQGITDYGPDDHAIEALMILQPGDAIIHHGNTIHRADPNRSATRHRRSFAMVIKGVSCQRDEAAYDRYLNAAKSQHQEHGLKV